MSRSFFGFAFFACVLCIGCGGSSGSGSANPNTCKDAPAIDPSVPQDVEIPSSSLHLRGRAHTNHLILSRNSSRAIAFPGYTPDQIRSVYAIPANAGWGTITIVEGFHNPSAQTDFNAFSAAFGLPQETSSDLTADTNAHLQVVYQGGKPPAYNSGWSQESDLDMQWVHAMAPNAKIVLVEAVSDNPENLMAADDLAATIPGAHQCSNSWSVAEMSTEFADEKHFKHAGVVCYFASGDTGGQQDYPPASPNVVAVGGTSLTLDAMNHRASETVWSGTGCGESRCMARPPYQDNLSSIVGTSRGIVDVSAVADPNTGVRVRWQGKWVVFGGTSAACPIIAGIANIANTSRSSAQDENGFLYTQVGSSNFFDITTGKAGMFSATTGWDFPSGVGTPNGAGGF